VRLLLRKENYMTHEIKDFEREPARCEPCGSRDGVDICPLCTAVNQEVKWASRMLTEEMPSSDSCG